MTHQCIICSATFGNKYYYSRHELMCRFMYKSKHEKRDDIESIDTKLTETQKDKLLSNLLYDFEKMKSEFDKMKEDVRLLKRKQKVSLEKWLNSPSGPIPQKTWRDWVLSIPVLNSHLELVFKNDLFVGMIECLKNAIDSYTEILPICAFHQKQKTLYYYNYREKTQVNKWEILDNEEMKKILNLLNHRFLQLFLKYEPTQLEQWSENEMMYSRKVMGKDMCENTRSSRIQEWLYSTLKRNFVEIEIL